MMIRKELAFIIFIFLLWAFELPAIVEETASFTDFLYGQTTACSYDNWISHVSEGIALEEYNLYSPWDVQTDGFGDFHIADSLDLYNWGSVVEVFLDGSFDLAQTLIDEYGFPYEVVQFEDTETGRIYFLLREILNMDYFDDNETVYTGDDEAGSFDFGWGLYVFNPEASNPIIITVPHPNDDFIAPAVSYEGFRNWDAMFLLINGAGREVKWTEQGSFNNSKSLSDPSRILAHAFNVCYHKFCDKIRLDFEQREFAPQIHSYDWNRHQGHPSCQISAGSGKNNPNLPIRDLSDTHNDIINNSNHLIIPANTIGTHAPVFFDDYYSVNYSLYEFEFHPEGGRLYIVNNNVDLPGYGQNRQMQYSVAGWNDYDVFEPFFHIEMDELPNCYEQTEEYYWSYYSYDELLGHFNMDDLFTNVLQFNSYWIDAMTETLPLAISLDDGIIPPTPQNFAISDQTFNSISLQWEHISSPDFYTYEIQFSDEPITGLNYISITRAGISTFADPRKESQMITNLDLNQQYYFRICTYDYNGDQSVVSEESFTWTGPAYISETIAVGGDGFCALHWTAVQQSGNMGFNIYQLLDNEMLLIDSWQTNPTLLGTNNLGENYSYTINDLPIEEFFSYKISCENEVGMEYIFPNILNCQTNKIFDLYFSNADGSIVDTVSFAMNQFATDEYDEYFDIVKDFEILPDYVCISFFNEEWAPGGMHLRQVTDYTFNAKSTYRYFQLNVSTNQLNQDLRISLDPEFQNFWNKLYIRDPDTNQITNLANNDFYFYTDSSEEKIFNLYWGNFAPSVNISSGENKIYQGGSPMMISWSTYNRQMIEYLRIYAVNDTDTLIIVNNLMNSVNRYNWTVSDNITMHNAKIGIDILTTEGETLRKLSFYKVGIVPSITTVSNEAGWHLVSNPWPADLNVGVEEIFGPDATLWQPVSNSQYEETEDFKFGKGYWLQTPAGYEFSSDTAILSNQYYEQLIPEWNLVANPHNCSYKLKDMYFLYNGLTRSFSYMNIIGLIPNMMVAYLDGAYTKVDSILPYQSFYIYTNTLPTDDVQCRFTPYYNMSFIPPSEAWKVKIKATQYDSAEIIMGASAQASDEFDFSLDLPLPPPKPFTDCVSIFIPKESAEEFPYQHLYQEFKTLMREGVPDTIRWDFSLTASPLATVTLEFDLSSMPKNYKASIYLTDNSWCNLVNNVYVYAFTSNQTAINSGYIEITNDLTGINGTLPLIFEFTNYPNPFNPETNIQFSLTDISDVELMIYNLKGQKVKTLIKSELDRGNYKYVWKGTDANNKQTASGIYFIRLQANDKILIRKTILLK